MTRKRDSTLGKKGELNTEGCDNDNISYNSLMDMMATVSERLQANTEVIKSDMVNWLTSLKKQLLRTNGGATEAYLKREENRKDKLLDALLDGVLSKEDYSKKAVTIDSRITEIKKEMLANRNSVEDIAEIDRLLANIDAELATYLDDNNQLKVDFILDHLERVEIFPDKVVVIIPLFSVGMVVYKNQYVSSEKAAGYKTEAKQVANPFRIFAIILVPLDSFNPLRIGNGNTDAAFFKNVKHGNPILSGGLHTNIKAVVCVKPIAKTVQIAILSGKAFLLVMRLNPSRGRDDSTHKKSFVNIHTAANRINNFQ